MTKKLSLVLWVCCIVGTWAILPYLYFLGVISPLTSFGTLFGVGTVEGAIFYGLILWLSYLLLHRTDIKPFKPKKQLRHIVAPGIISGVILGGVLLLLERVVFQHDHYFTPPPIWIGIFSAFYGAFNEEVLCRLFLLTLIFFVLNKLVKKPARYRSTFLWCAVFLAAVGFAAGHLSLAMKLGPITGYETMRILVLNSIAGIVFGWLYCRVGFFSASIGHFTTGIMIHVLFA